MGRAKSKTVGERRFELRLENAVLRGAARCHKVIEKALGRFGGNPIDTWQQSERISETLQRNLSELEAMAHRDPWEKL